MKVKQPRLPLPKGLLLLLCVVVLPCCSLAQRLSAPQLDAIRAFEKRFDIKPGIKLDASVGPLGNDGIISVSDGSTQISLRSSDLKMLWYTRHAPSWPKLPKGQKFKTFGEAFNWAESELKPEYAPLKLKPTAETKQKGRDENLNPDEIVRIVWREDRGPIQVIGGNQVEIQTRAGDGLVTTFVYLSDYKIEENKTPKLTKAEAIERASSQLGDKAELAEAKLVYADNTPGTKKHDKFLSLAYIVSNGDTRILVNAATGEVTSPPTLVGQNGKDDDEPSQSSSSIYLAAFVVTAVIGSLLLYKLVRNRS